MNRDDIEGRWISRRPSRARMTASSASSREDTSLDRIPLISSSSRTTRESSSDLRSSSSRSTRESSSALMSRRLKQSSASASASASSTSAHDPPMNNCDVFISFSKRDGQGDFASYLDEALSNVGLITMIDHSFGNELNQTLENIIKNSRCWIVVLSKDYATDNRRLRVLAKIMDCMSETTQQVIPVFYHIDPSHVRDRSGVFKKSFDRYETRALVEENQIQRWRAAVTKISNLPGVFVTKESHELEIIKKTRKQIFDMLCPNVVVPDRYKNLVEMPPRLHRMNMLLSLESNDVRFIGILGMNGIGKTTIAEVVYNNIAPKFKSNCCFLRISEENIVSLQYQLLSQLLLNKNIKILNENHGEEIIQNHLSHRKVLIVLDGVYETRQLLKLAGRLNWFGAGSRVIITTRDKNNVRFNPNILKYNVELLDHDSSMSLFCKHAFGDDPPNEKFMHLVEKIVEKVKGHPLALIKIGSFLYGKSRDIWEENLKSCHELVYQYISFDSLKTSYEELDANSKKIFRDLTCFFKGEKVNRVIKILKLYGYGQTLIKLYLLVDKYLINILDEKIWMHTSILHMGQEIELGDLRRRIWLREDVRRIFHEKEGLVYVQGIVMDLEEEEELVLEAKSFTHMCWLKLLVINNVKLIGEVEFLSNSLRLLNWPGYPSQYLPSTFESITLRELNLPGSNVVQLWEGNKAFIHLREIDVSDSEYLVETPDFSKVLRLRRLILRNCVRLCAVHPSINSLGRLVLLDMEGCVNLKSFPSNMISCKNLETLILSNSGLEHFPEIEGSMERLTELHLDGTVIKHLHHSIGNLTALALLNIRNCTELSSLPEEMGSLRSLKTLILNGCKNLDQIPQSLGEIESLEELDIGGTDKHSISDAPLAIGSLWNLKILNCERLQRNIWHSLTALFGDVCFIKDLNLSECNLVDEDIPDDLHCFSLLEILDLTGNHFVLLSESLSQLVNLKALYLNDCVRLQQLPKLPPSLQYLGGEKSWDMLQNSEGSSRSISSPSPSNLPLMTKFEILADDVAKEENSPHQVDIVSKTGKQIFQSSHSKLLVSGENLVGMEDRVKEVCNLLDLKGSNGVLYVGIFGTAGIGKTSIAEVVYDKIADGFGNSCLLHISGQSSVVSLQLQLLSQLGLKKEDIKVRDEDYGAQMIQNHVSGRKVLIVLDGVEEKRQVEKLVGSPDWFNLESRVIITTRNRDLLHQPIYKGKMQEYKVKLLDHESAYSLFCKQAFGDNPPDKNDLCNEIVKKIGRVPLALRIIGSFLRNKDLAVWEETLMSLGKVEEDFFDTISKKRNEKNYTTKVSH